MPTRDDAQEMCEIMADVIFRAIRENHWHFSSHGTPPRREEVRIVPGQISGSTSLLEVGFTYYGSDDATDACRVTVASDWEPPFEDADDA